jgi:phosphoglycolate phosphatase
LPAGRSSKFTAVLFDLDGTLIEFKFEAKKSRVHMISWLNGIGFDTGELSNESKTQEILQYVRTKCSSFGSLSYPQIKESLYGILDDYEFKAFSIARPHPGSLGLLKDLKSKQMLCGLVTNSGRKPVDSILGAFGFLHYLSTVITRDEVENLKPEPDGLLAAIRDLRVSAEQSVYVGDSILDIRAAKKADMACIALSEGMYDRETLAQEKPDFMVSKIEDVEKIIFL